MSPARARTRSAHSGVERANHEATAVKTTYKTTLGARGFFLVGGDRIERQSREGESRSGEEKTSGTNG